MKLQLEILKKENEVLKDMNKDLLKTNRILVEQNSRLNHFVDLHLGIKEIDFPNDTKEV